MKHRLSLRFGKGHRTYRGVTPNVELPHRLLDDYQYGVFHLRLLPSFQFEHISPAFILLTGYSIEEFTADPDLARRIIHPDDSFWLNSLVFPTGHPASSDPITLRIFDKTGTLVWLELFIKPIFDSHDTLVALEGIGHEVTRRKENEMRSEESRVLLSSIIGTAMDAMIVLDSEFKICLFNLAAEEMFQSSMNEVLGGTLDRFLPRNIGAWHEDKMKAFGETRRLHHRMGLMRDTLGIRSNGEEFPIEISLSVFEISDNKFYTAIVRDITERKKAEKELRHMSTHDSLTGLYNRLFFEEEMRRLDQGRISPVSIVIADMDGLKFINDNFGHQRGDEIIREIGQAIKTAFRGEDVVARLGGDEFGVLLPQADPEVTNSAIERIYSRLWDYAKEKPENLYNLSIGAATAEENEPLEETMRRADKNMYRHKNSKAHRRAAG